jgi:hypothetical protein
MLRRSLAGLFVVLAIGGMVLAEETRGFATKVEDGSITIQTFGTKKGEKGEAKTFKVSKEVKVVRVAGKDKEDVKLTLDELKTAMKVTNVFVTITHDGDTGTEIKVGGGFGGRPGKDKKKEADKKDQ